MVRGETPIGANMRQLSTLLVLVCCMALFACESKSSSDPDKLKIAVIPKGNTHAFWKSVQASPHRVMTVFVGLRIL